MVVRTVFMVAIALSLGGCADAPPWKGGPVASGRSDLPPHQSSRRRTANEAHAAPDPVIAEDDLLNTLDPRSAAWRIASDKIEADRDRRLAAKLVICRGCFPATRDNKDATASIQSSADR